MTDKKKVLVVDDDYIVRAVLTKMSESHGAVVTSAKDGKEGLEAVEAIEAREDYDLVFLDLLMPHLSGWEVLDAIGRNPNAQDIPVVIITGAPVSDEEKKKLSQRATAFVDKETFSLAKFELIVEEILDR